MRLPVFLVASAVLLAPQLASAQTSPPPASPVPLSPRPVAPTASKPGSAPPPPAETVRLHVEGPTNTEVLVRPNDHTEWTGICRPPCDKPVPLGWEYRVRGG